jgi:hypothetical protein
MISRADRTISREKGYGVSVVGLTNRKAMNDSHGIKRGATPTSGKTALMHMALSKIHRNILRHAVLKSVQRPARRKAPSDLGLAFDPQAGH